MADSDKDILITPNTGQTAQPVIKFAGADNTPVYLRVLDDGTVSFEGTAGQLFSISDGLTGSIFSVNDISGIPSIEVFDTGAIKLAQYGGSVSIGETTSADLTVNGIITGTTFSGSGASLTSIPQSAVTNLTTDLGNKQPLDADLTAIAALAGTSGLLKKTAADTWTLDTTAYTTNTGTVTSVGMTVPTGLSISGSPITTSGTLALTLTAGYSIPTTASQTNWNTAYTDRNKWDGGATGLNAATGRTSLGGTTVGQNLFTLTNPSAVTFPRINADNTVSALSAASFLSAIGGISGNQTITLSGDVSGSGTTAITVTVADDSHNHIIGNVDGLQAALDLKSPIASPTFTGKVTTAATSAGSAGLNLPHGTAPSAPANGDVWTTTAGLYVRVNGSTVGPLAPSSGAATWGSITGTLSSQTDLNTALNAKAPTASPTFTGTVTASTITPSSGYLALNYGTGAFDAVRSGQLQVLRDGVGDWNTLFAAYGTAAEVAADTPRFIVYGLGAFEATYEGKISNGGSAYLKIDGGSGYERQVQFMTNSSLRWTFGAAPNAETGSNAGSTFSIARYSDAGAWIDNPFEISRATGTVSLKGIWLTDGWISNLSNPVNGYDAANKTYVDTQDALKAPLASPTFTGDITVRDAIYIQGNTGGAAEGGAELRAGGSTYTFVIAPRNSDATFATNSEFYYQATGHSGTGLWAFEAPLIVNGQTAGAGKYSEIDGIRIENVSTGWREIRTPGDNLRIAGGTTATSHIVFPYNTNYIEVVSGGLRVPASTTSYSSLRVPHGTAPSSPTNGDIWTTTSSMMLRLNGTSVNLLGTQGSTYVTIDDEQIMRVMGL